MKLLLDTHIWLWSALDPSHLSKRIRRALEDVRNELWLSPMTVWEVLVLARKKRVVLEPTPEQWIRRLRLDTGDCRQTVVEEPAGADPRKSVIECAGHCIHDVQLEKEPSKSYFDASRSSSHRSSMKLSGLARHGALSPLTRRWTMCGLTRL